MPREGEETIITATIKNAGFEDTVVVRFYFGDPASVGVQIGTDQIIPSLPLDSSTQISITASFTGTCGKTIFVVAASDNLISETKRLSDAELKIGQVEHSAGFRKRGYAFLSGRNSTIFSMSWSSPACPMMQRSLMHLAMEILSGCAYSTPQNDLPVR